MKKVIYFFTIGLILTSCKISGEIYDDVYDAPTYQSTANIESENGYSDYIKSEEKNYRVEPEEDHYSSTISTSQDNNTFYHSQPTPYFYQCAYHNYYHSHLTDDFMCREHIYINSPYTSMYTNNYSPFSPINYYGNTYGYNYSAYGYNCGFNAQNAYWGNYGNIDPYTNQGFTYYNPNNNNYIATNSVSSNHTYGHRNGRYHGTRSSNTTSFPNTVKASNKPLTQTKPNQTLTASKYKTRQSTTSTHHTKVKRKRTTTQPYKTTRPAQNKFNKPTRPTNTTTASTSKRTTRTSKYKPNTSVTVKTNTSRRTSSTYRTSRTSATRPNRPTTQKATPRRSSTSTQRGGRATQNNNSTRRSSSSKRTTRR